MIKKMMLFIILGLIIILNLKGFSQEKIPECFEYEGDLQKRGNVKNATEAFDLLLNFDDFIKDGRVSTSFLMEKGKEKDFYAPWKANDNDKGTAWVEGVKNEGLGQKIFLKIRGSQIYKFKGFNVKFSIINGYAKTEKLFKENNRIKKARLTVYEAKFDVCGGLYSTRYSDLVINSSRIIELKDSTDPQFFNLEIINIKSINEMNEDNQFDSYLYIAELEILEVYKGSKFDDTAISEFNVEVNNKE